MAKPEKYSDTKDIINLANTYLDLRRCAGGRIIVARYCCRHCGSANPSEECGQPKIGSTEAKKQNPVANESEQE